MKIAYVTVASLPSSTAHASYAANLCDALGRNGCDILLLGAKGPLDEAQHRLDFPHLTLHTIGWRGLTRHSYLKLILMAGMLLFRGARWQSERLFVTHNEVLAAAFVLQGRKFIFDMHDFGPSGRILKYILRSANCLGCFFSASTVQHAFESRIAPVGKPKLVLGNAIDPKYLKPRGDRMALRSALSIAADRTVIAHIGSMGKDRGIDLMLQAAASGKFPNLFWLFVGGRPDEVTAWRRQAAAAGLRDDTVRFVGFQRQETLGDWYEISDVLCAPYRRTLRGWDYVASMKLLEYQAVGKYAVVAAMPYALEVLSPQNTAFFEPGEPGAFDRALAEALRAVKMKSYRPAMFLENTWDAKAKTLMAWAQTIQDESMEARAASYANTPHER